MKKLLCLLLSISMIATLFVATGVSAAEVGKVETGYTPNGTAINSAADFAAMSATGSYYLNADITVDTTWNGGAALSATYASNTAFKGTLDGNGHTITTSVPLFANLAGTVKNLTIEGEIAGLTVGTTALNNAAVALYASGAFTLDNVCNKANVLSAPYSAGFVAFCATKGAIVSIKNCANYGNIYATTRNGGVIAYLQGGVITVENTVNYGDIISNGTGTYVYTAGIIALVGSVDKPYATPETSQVTIKNCINNGKITSNRSYTGGIAAMAYGYLEIVDCVNNGAVESYSATSGVAAGILATATTRDSYAGILIKGCINSADVKGALHAAGIVGYLGNGTAATGYTYKVKGCANYGDIYLTPSVAVTSTYMRVGGIAAYAYGTAGNGITDSISTGDIHADISKVTTKVTHIGGIVGYVNGAGFEFRNNIMTGKINITGADKAGTAPIVAMTMYNSNAAAPTKTENNYTVSGGNIASMNLKTAVKDEYVTVVTDAQVASGELAFLANEGAGKTIFFQKIGTDAAPVITPDGTNFVEGAGDAYINVNKWPEITDDPEEPDEPETPTIDPSTIPVPAVPDKTVSLPDAGKLGKVDAGYTPEGTAVTSSAEFAAMKADGKYYLANDITIDATWNAGKAVNSTYSVNTAFTGTLDGNGHKITTTVPLFANVAGTVKNLNVDGEIKATKLHNAAVAIYVSGAATFENIYNKANILGGQNCGAIVGHAASGAKTYVISCRNDGSVTGDAYLGGLVGYAENYIIYILDSVNCGSVSSLSTDMNASLVGGIIGRFGKDAAVAASSFCKIENCDNYGKVTTVTGKAAGILAYVSGYAHIENCDNYGNVINRVSAAAGIFGISSTKAGSSGIQIEDCVNYGNIGSGSVACGIAARLGNATVESYYIYNLTRCVNNGDIYSLSYTGAAETAYAAGIAGYAYGGSTPNGITSCVNTGKITIDTTKTTKGSYVAAIIGYVNGAAYTAQNNINTGEISVTGNTTVAVRLIYNKAGSPTATFNNYSVAGTLPLVKFSSSTVTAAEIASEVTADQLASGELAVKMNELATIVNLGKETIVMYQNLGSDAIPTPDRTHKIVVKNADGTYSNKESEVVTPPAQEDTTTAPSDETTKTPTDDTTNTPTDTTVSTPDVTTEEPKQNGCGGVSLAATLFTVIVSAFAFVVIKKKN